MRYKIIHIVLFVVFAFLCNSIIAQPCDSLTKYFKGAVILRAEKKKDVPGSTRYGCIKLMNAQEMFVAPNLLDSSGKADRYFGREALAYWYTRNNDTVYYLNAGQNLKQYKWIYMERIVKGPMELYNFTLKGTTNLLLYTTVEYKYYYLRKDGKWLNRKAIVWNEGGKRDQLQKIFNDCKPALELISNTQGLMLDELLPQLVTLYNNSCF